MIYPKDLAPICMLADIGPGVRVFETGIGSGALSMTMLRWAATIVGYEIREDFAQRAMANVRRVPRGACARSLRRPHRRQLRGIDAALGAVRPRRARPARAVAGRAARRAGAARRRDARRLHAVDHAGGAHARELTGRWIDARTIEVLHRGWHIDGQAVRPDHRMVAHTAFLTVARCRQQGSGRPKVDAGVSGAMARLACRSAVIG